MSTENKNQFRSVPQRPTPLLPWDVVAHGSSGEPDGRMMWAQSGLNRFFCALSDLTLWVVTRGNRSSLPAKPWRSELQKREVQSTLLRHAR
jgi:hypothetical protein